MSAPYNVSSTKMITFTVKDIASNKALISVLSELKSNVNPIIKLHVDDFYSDWNPTKKLGEKIISSAEELGDIQLTCSNIDGNFGDEGFSKVYVKPVFDSVRRDGDYLVFAVHGDSFKSLCNISNFLFHHYRLDELIGMKSRYSLNMLLSCLDLMVLKKESSLSFRQISYMCELGLDAAETRLFYRDVVQPFFADCSKLRKVPIQHSTLRKLNPETKRPQAFALVLSSPWLQTATA